MVVIVLILAVVPVQAFLEVLHPSIYFRLGFQKPLTDAFLNDRQVIWKEIAISVLIISLFGIFRICYHQRNYAPHHHKARSASARSPSAALANEGLIGGSACSAPPHYSARPVGGRIVRLLLIAVAKSTSMYVEVVVAFLLAYSGPTCLLNSISIGWHQKKDIRGPRNTK